MECLWNIITFPRRDKKNEVSTKPTLRRMLDTRQAPETRKAKQECIEGRQCESTGTPTELYSIKNDLL